ncbi:hypothetical protein HHX47_DHR5000781 [Lentinula edodes]|nr:hypothetical protein HHX47_DHR5000781 [Lentinula edodes]
MGVCSLRNSVNMVLLGAAWERPKSSPWTVTHPTESGPRHKSSRRDLDLAHPSSKPPDKRRSIRDGTLPLRGVELLATARSVGLRIFLVQRSENNDSSKRVDELHLGRLPTVEIRTEDRNIYKLYKSIPRLNPHLGGGSHPTTISKFHGG